MTNESSWTDQASGSGRRYLALWFPFLATDRLRREHRQPSGAPDERPLVTVGKERGALRLVDCDRAAREAGLSPGMTLADARARLPGLAVAGTEPEADAAFLSRIAAWCDRFTPMVALDPPHGLLLDVTGATHLFGGETRLHALVGREIARRGLALRATLAGTPEAASALARFGRCDICPPGEEAAAVRPLPVAALRLPVETGIALSRAGLKRLGDLMDRPSVALAARFGAELTSRLDRLAGRENRRITPLRPPPACHAARSFVEPLTAIEAIELALADLIADVCHLLEARGEGGRAFEATFFRSDGATRRISIETGKPNREATSLLRLFHERLEALADPLDPGFGFDLIRLGVLRSESFAEAEPDFGGGGSADEEVAGLIDRLVARFGRDRVLGFEAVDTHHPARAGRLVPAGADHDGRMARLPAVLRGSPDVASGLAPQDEDPGGWQSARIVALSGSPHPEVRPRTCSGGASKGRGPGAPAGSRPPAGDRPDRPLQIFAPPQPVETLAEVPDGPPLRFRWRRVLHEVARAEGPERIAPEWWQDGPDEPTRDYFRVEDAAGRRFWLFRAGLYERETEQPRWYLHGLFA